MILIVKSIAKHFLSISHLLVKEERLGSSRLKITNFFDSTIPYKNEDESQQRFLDQLYVFFNQDVICQGDA
jgi:hypothetical protein